MSKLLDYLKQQLGTQTEQIVPHFFCPACLEDLTHEVLANQRRGIEARQSIHMHMGDCARRHAFDLLHTFFQQWGPQLDDPDRDINSHDLFAAVEGLYSDWKKIVVYKVLE